MKFVQCLHTIYLESKQTLFGEENSFCGRNFLRGDFPRGEFSMGREASENQLQIFSI